MSAVYLDVLKDRLYCSAAHEDTRKRGQSVLYLILSSLLKLLAPILSFTAEEAWQHLPGDREESVHLSEFPSPDSRYDDANIEQTWGMLLAVREQVLKHLERAREQKHIGNSLEAAVRLTMPEKLYRSVISYKDMLPDIFIVSSVDLAESSEKADNDVDRMIESIGVSISRAEGKKCLRCWKYYREPEPELCPRCSRAAATYHAD
jgi:isoleucyl-tRNA synthetase